MRVHFMGRALWIETAVPKMRVKPYCRSQVVARPANYATAACRSRCLCMLETPTRHLEHLLRVLYALCVAWSLVQGTKNIHQYEIPSKMDTLERYLVLSYSVQGMRVCKAVAASTPWCLEVGTQGIHDTKQVRRIHC